MLGQLNVFDLYLVTGAIVLKHFYYILKFHFDLCVSPNPMHTNLNSLPEHNGCYTYGNLTHSVA